MLLKSKTPSNTTYFIVSFVTRNYIAGTVKSKRLRVGVIPKNLNEGLSTCKISAIKEFSSFSIFYRVHESEVSTCHTNSLLQQID